MSESENISRLPTRDFCTGDWVEWEENGETFEGWIIDIQGIAYVDYDGGQREQQCIVRLNKDELKTVMAKNLTFIDDSSVSGIMNRLRPLGNNAGPTVTSYSQQTKTGPLDFLRR